MNHCEIAESPAKKLSGHSGRLPDKAGHNAFKSCNLARLLRWQDSAYRVRRFAKSVIDCRNGGGTSASPYSAANCCVVARCGLPVVRCKLSEAPSTCALASAIVFQIRGVWQPL